MKLPEQFKSTFEEAPHIGDGTMVIEDAQKIFNIDNRIVLSFAGTVVEGQEAIEQILIKHKGQKKLTQFLSDYFTNKEITETKYIIGYYEKGVPHLFTYSPENGITIETHDGASKAAGVDLHGFEDTLYDAMRESLSVKATAQENLMLNLATMQTMALHFLTLQHGVGGFFNGAVLLQKGVEWAKDTIYVQFSAHHLNEGKKYYTFRYNRQDSTFIRTEEMNRLFISTINRINSDEIINRWGYKVVEIANKSLAEFYVFIAYDTKTVIVINNKKDPKIMLDGNKIVIPKEITKWMMQYYNDKFIVQTNYIK